MVHNGYSHLPTGDLQAILRIQQWGGDALAVDLATLFTTEAPKQILAIRQGLSTDSCETAERAAHSLKSSSAQLGASRMRHICEEIEVLAGGRTVDSLSALVDALEAEFASFATWLAQTTNTMRGSQDGHNPERRDMKSIAVVEDKPRPQRADDSSASQERRT